MSDINRLLTDIENTIHDYCYRTELEYDWDGDELVINADEKGKEHVEEIIKILHGAELVPGAKAYYYEGKDEDKRDVYKVGMFKLDS
jgi:hypothetical protein|tara:strand:+ start:323 stop:583 length:261 start_codon:yes stop_codon:yes gene_type:complete